MYIYTTISEKEINTDSGKQAYKSTIMKVTTIMTMAMTIPTIVTIMTMTMTLTITILCCLLVALVI